VHLQWNAILFTVACQHAVIALAWNIAICLLAHASQQDRRMRWKDVALYKNYQGDMLQHGNYAGRDELKSFFATIPYCLLSKRSGIDNTGK
jgi:hypothetical protein